MFKKTKKYLKSITSYGFLKESSAFTLATAKGLFKIPQKPTTHEFTAIKDLKLSPEHIQHSRKAFKLLMYFYLVLSGTIFCYSVLNLYQYSFLTSILGFCACAVCAVMAFKYNFWLVQIKKGYLGISFKEWFESSWKNL